MATNFIKEAKRRYGKTEISILVCGATGVGKSTLINFILGVDVCEIGFSLDSDREAIRTIVLKPDMTIYESSDSSVDSAKDLFMKYKEVDLILYCQKMTRIRLLPEETATFLRALTGGGFLDKTILVLTKANLVEPFGMDEDAVEYFRDVYSVMTTLTLSEVSSYRSSANETLSEVSSYRSRTKEEGSRGAPLSVVPVGSARYPTLPNGKHFMGNIYVSCLEHLPLDKRKKFMQVTNLSERLIMSYRDPSLRESLAEHIRTMSSSGGKEPLTYPVYMDEEDSERLGKMHINVCEFRYAGCKKVSYHKEMEEHMKSFRDSKKHITILAVQLESLYLQYQELHQQYTELHEQGVSSS